MLVRKSNYMTRVPLALVVALSAAAFLPGCHDESSDIRVIPHPGRSQKPPNGRAMAATQHRTSTTITEADLGVPFYPGSKEVPGTGMKSKQGAATTLVSVRSTTDPASKVIAFYTGKLGKPDQPTTATSVSARWTAAKKVVTVATSKGSKPGETNISLDVSNSK